MSKFNLTESLVCSIFETDLQYRIDCLHRLLYSDVPMEIVKSMAFERHRYRRLRLIRQRLYAKLCAYRSALEMFHDACSFEGCAYVTV